MSTVIEGATAAAVAPGITVTPEDAVRFWAKVIKHPNGFWEWTAKTNCHGYGRFWLNGREESAHRVAYVIAHGPIPSGLHIDHTCHNASTTCFGGDTCSHRRCVNPDDLQAVTAGENVRRSPTHGHNQYVGATHCVHGHPFTGDNLLVLPGGKRACRACAHRRDQARQPRRRGSKA